MHGAGGRGGGYGYANFVYDRNSPTRIGGVASTAAKADCSRLIMFSWMSEGVGMSGADLRIAGPGGPCVRWGEKGRGWWMGGMGWGGIGWNAWVCVCGHLLHLG